MNQKEIQNYKIGLVGKWVRFRIGRKRHYGRVSSLEQDIANIRGIEQKKYTKPAYHYDYREIQVCSHDEVFNLGRSIKALFR